jgi:hypothetical protein
MHLSCVGFARRLRVVNMLVVDCIYTGCGAGPVRSRKSRCHFIAETSSRELPAPYP